MYSSSQERYKILSNQPSAVLLSPQELDDRLDAYPFEARFLHPLERLLNWKGGELRQLDKLADKIRCGPFGATIHADTYVEQGVLLVRPFNLMECTVTGDDLAYILEADCKKNNLEFYDPGDLFFARVGNISFGVVPKTDTKITISPNIIAAKFGSKKADSHYICAFMNTIYGSSQLQRQLKIVAQPTISTEAVRKLLIPLPPPEIQTYIGDKVRLAERCREEAQCSLDQARELLVEAVDFNLYNHSVAITVTSGKFYKIINRTPACVEVSASLLGNGITAERYLPIDLAKDETLKSHKIQLAHLGEIAKDFINGYDYRDFKLEGTPYLKVANIRANEVVLDGVQFVSVEVASLSSKFQMRRGDLLITRKGSFGICTTVLPQMEKMIFSSEIIRVPLKTGWDSDYIALFLNSPFGRYQFDRLSTGTTMKGINHENLGDVGVPKLDLQVQIKIGDHVRKFMQLTEKAKDLISEAKSDVEKLIEGKLDIEGIMAGRVKAPTWEDIQAILMERV